MKVINTKSSNKILVLILGIIFVILIFSGKPVMATVGRINDGMIYNIKNVNSGKYLNVNLANDTNGTNVIQWTGDGSIEQKFRVVYYSGEGAYRIYPMCSEKGSNRVLDVLRTGGSSTGNIESGNNVDIWSTGDNACQFFFIQGESSSNNNFKFSIRLKSNSNLVLTAYGTGNGSGAGKTATSSGNVFVSTWNGSNSQLWNFEEIAAAPAYPYKNKRGISNQTYYIESSTNEYSDYISGGIGLWNSTITLGRVYDNSSSSVDFYKKPNDFFEDSNVLAATERFTGSTSINCNYNNWAYSKVYLNTNFFSSNDSAEGKKAVVAHELGHAYGLKHYDGTYTIMRTYYDDMARQPQNIDRTGILYKY